MKIYKILVGISIFFTLFSTNLYANYSVNSKLEKVFNNFMIQIERKLTLEKEIIFLETLNSRIVTIAERKKLNSKKQKLLGDLIILSNEKLFELETKKLLQNKTQLLLESHYVGALRKKLHSIRIPDFVKKLQSRNREILLVSDKYEFVEDNGIKRFSFSKYFPLKSSNANIFKYKSGTILIQENGKISFVESGKKISKIPYSQAYKYTKGYITKQKKYFKDGTNFYSYNFKNFTYLEDTYGFYKQDLIKNGIKLSEVILYLSDNKKYNFITNFTQVKLINRDIIYGVTDKKKFLEHLANDKLYLTGDTDSSFLSLKKEINTLTNGQTQSKKIKSIYSWTLNNVSYTRNLDINDKKIFSGILTYKNKDGVCEGYAKLASYALMFAGIPDTNVLRGDVVDAQDFPKIGHAWLKIGNKYYDPTFDDPLGATKTKSYSEYKYFGLPKDLLYANRFDYGVTPQFLKTRSLEYRKNFVNKRLSLLSDKYQSKNYLVLQGVDYNKSVGLAVGEKIDLAKAKQLLIYGEVTEKQSGELKVLLNGKRKNITKLQYYIVTDENINQIFEQKNYNTGGLYLFKWKKKNGSVEYRVGFDVVIK